MSEKALFFDIDGTLVNQDGVFSESAKKGLTLARQKGHKLLLATGRNFAQVYPELKDFAFDGFVCAAGANVRCEGELIYHRTMDEDLLRPITDYFVAHDVMAGLQVEDGSYMTPRGYQQIQEGFERMGIPVQNRDSVLGGVHLVEDFRRVKGIEKLFYNWADKTVEQMGQLAGDYFLVQATSFGDQLDQYSGEITIRGVNKALGIAKALEYYGLRREDSIGFGDAFNDLEMMEYTGIGVAMGNARPQVKEKADYVTSHIDQDGIYQALLHLDLI